MLLLLQYHYRYRHHHSYYFRYLFNEPIHCQLGWDAKTLRRFLM